jgi:hypothetical protein
MVTPVDSNAQNGLILLFASHELPVASYIMEIGITSKNSVKEESYTLLTPWIYAFGFAFLCTCSLLLYWGYRMRKKTNRVVVSMILIFI